MSFGLTSNTDRSSNPTSNASPENKSYIKASISLMRIPYICTYMHMYIYTSHIHAYLIYEVYIYIYMYVHINGIYIYHCTYYSPFEESGPRLMRGQEMKIWQNSSACQGKEAEGQGWIVLERPTRSTQTAPSLRLQAISAAVFLRKPDYIIC